jgi:hypothetical protein
MPDEGAFFAQNPQFMPLIALLMDFNRRINTRINRAPAD